MKTRLNTLALLLALAHPATAQDNLIPDTNVFADPNSYLLKMRHVFAPAFEEGVTVRALVLRSFAKEFVVGLQFGDKDVEAFVLEASSSIWDTELLEMYKNGEIGPSTTPDGKEIPLEEDEQYRALKKRTPADYRQIKPVRYAQSLPRDLAEGIKTLWETMLLDVRHPRNASGGLDGTDYHFSAWICGRGDLSGTIWSPDRASKAGRLATLADSLAGFARGGVSLKTLTDELATARKAIQP